jgi:hypothetical protein
MKPNVLDVNVATGEQTVREMTDAEYAQYLIDQEANATETE